MSTSSPTDLVLDALRAHGYEPKPSGSAWICRCPAHEDRSPSLSIGIGEEERALLHCHAGCSAQSITESIGLSLGDLFPDTNTSECLSRAPERTPKPTHKPPTSYATAQDAVKAMERTRGPRVGVWTYHDAQGDPVGVVVRWDTGNGKSILPISRNGAGWHTGGMAEPRPLYGLPELLKSEGVVYVCEGE